MATLLSPAANLVNTLADMSASTLTDVRSLGDLVQRFAEPMSSVCDDLLAEAGHYRRSLLYRTDRFELLLLRWGSGAVSPVHDHARQTCVFTVLRGELAVDDYELDRTQQTKGLYPVYQTRSGPVTPGMLDYRKGEHDIHRVRCPGDAVSLHVYAAPIARCGIYDTQTSKRFLQRLSYDDVRVDLITG